MKLCTLFTDYGRRIIINPIHVVSVEEYDSWRTIVYSYMDESYRVKGNIDEVVEQINNCLN